MVGVNGSGKSTLFRIAAGFVTPTSGSVAICSDAGASQEITGLPPVARVRRGLAYIAQDRRLLSRLSTLDNLKISATTVRRSVDDICEDLAQLKLTFILGKRPTEMKPGEIVLLLLACAYVRRPRFLIADEPFAGLDGKRAIHCGSILLRMKTEGVGIILSDHDPAAVLALADTVAIMRDGAILYHDAAAAVRNAPEAARLYFRRNA